VNQLLLELGNVVFGRRGDWYLLDLDSAIDFAGDAGRLVGSLELGRLLVGRVGLFVRGGTHLAGSRQLDYFLDGGLRYLFRLEKTR
jgi:hypothetical protein